MNYAERRTAVERESGTITAGLRSGRLDVKVPTCPDWTLVELSTHLGQFCALWAHVICEATGRPKTPYADPEPEETRSEWFADWFEEQAGHLTGLLGALPADTAAWTWDTSDQTLGFIARRAAHELAVHRFDVQSARSAPEPIDGALAVDGIEEIFAMIAAWRAAGQDVGTGNGETLHLHASDPGAEWIVTLGPEGTQVERSHRQADLALRGAASDLELVLYDRPPLGQVERSGDQQVLDAWHRAFHFG